MQAIYILVNITTKTHEEIKKDNNIVSKLSLKSANSLIK